MGHCEQVAVNNYLQLGHCKLIIVNRCFVMVILTVNSKLLQRHSKVKSRAPAYSRALLQIRGNSPREVQVREPEGQRRQRRVIDRGAGGR